jgi:hypothetical protein
MSYLSNSLVHETQQRSVVTRNLNEVNFLNDKLMFA